MAFAATASQGTEGDSKERCKARAAEAGRHCKVLRYSDILRGHREMHLGAVSL